MSPQPSFNPEIARERQRELLAAALARRQRRPRPSPGRSLNPHHERRWAILGVLAVAQLMVVLDATVINIALPSTQRDLGFSDDARQWIVTAYALAYGSLLLLGGRLGDLFGRKWTFAGGLIGFAAVSAIGGLAQSLGVLVAARAIQGVFGALLAPSALALVSTTFTDPGERARAFGIFSGVIASGGAVGLLLGGALTEWLSWRWCLFINLLFALPAALLALRLLVNRPRRGRPRLDLPGTLSATLGLFCLVSGFSSFETRSWGHPLTLAMLAASVVLLAGFVAIEARAAHPLLPLRLVRDRTRAGAYLGLGLTAAGLFGAFLLLTYLFQRTKGYSALTAGFAYLPLTAAIVATAIAVNLVALRRAGARALLVLGMLLGAMVWLAQLTPRSGYAGYVLPGLVVLGAGWGAVYATTIATATQGVAHHDTGVASALVSTMTQVGASVGTALLSSVSAGAVHGYTTGFWVCAGLFAAGAVLVGALMRGRHAEPELAAEPEPAALAA
jgi:EmrB/QacA subfamily drug resistance transporter